MSIAHLGLLGIGGLLMAIPVLLHFLMKPKPVHMTFPAMRFLQEKHITSRSKTRLRHFLLLLLRCLLILLVAAAFAGPAAATEDFGNWVTLGGTGLITLLVGFVAAAAYLSDNRNQLLVSVLGAIALLLAMFFAWNAWQIFSSSSSGKLLGQSGTPVAAIVLVDNSATMEYRFQNETRLESAKETASWLISQFPSESQVCVLAVDRDTPFFSVDTSAADKRLSKIDPTYNAESIPSALARAYKLFDKVKQERREIYIFSDLTSKSWAAGESNVALKQLSKDETISMFVIDVGVEQPINTALDQLEIADAVISSNGELNIETSVTQTGGAETSSKSQLSVRMKVFQQDETKPVVRDGNTVFVDAVQGEKSKTVTLPPTSLGETNGVALDFSFSDSLEEGTWHGEVEILGADALPVDNKRYFSFEVSPPNQVLVIHGDDVSPGNLISCIAPRELQERGKSRFECTVVSQSEFDVATKLSQFALVYVLDPGPAGKLWGPLKEFVEAGGRAVVYLGHNAVSRGAPHQSFLTQDAVDVLCGKLLFPFRSIEGDVYLSPDKFDHPALKTFRGISSNVPWSKHPVYYHWGIEREESWENFPTEVVMPYGNREPALIQRTIGAGTVMVMTTPISEPANSPDRDVWNELFLGLPWPAFSLTVEMSKYLADNGARSLNVLVGENAVLQNDLTLYSENYRAFSPVPEKPPTPLTTVSGQLSYKFVDAPGNYYLKPLQDGFSGNRGFCANIDRRQTDLTRAQQSELDIVLGEGRYLLARDRNEIEFQQGTSRRGQEFFPLLMLSALIVMAVEHLLANRFYKS